MAFIPALNQAIKNQVLCPLARANSALANSAQSALANAGVNIPIAAIPNTLKAAFCPIPEKPQPVPPPFQGGQCPGVNYRVDIFYSYESLQGDGAWVPLDRDNRFFASGPIRFLGVKDDFQATGSPCGGEVTNKNAHFLVGVSGEPLVRRLVEIFECSPFIGGNRNFSLGSIVVTRTDDQPDNCGDPPPLVDPPIPPEGLPPAPINFNFEPGIGLPPVLVTGNVVVLPPIINLKGELNIPLKVDVDVNLTGNFEFNANLNVSTGDLNLHFGGKPGNRNPGIEDCNPDYTEPDGDVPSPPVNVGPGDSPRPEEGEETIVGVLVTVTEITPTARPSVLGQVENPDIWVPSLGHVNFLCRTGKGATAGWTPDQPVKNRRCLIPCPWPYGAIEVKGTPQPGVSWVLNPIKDKRRSPVV